MEAHMENNKSVRVYTFIDDNTDNEERHGNNWWRKICLRCHQADSTPSWRPTWWNRLCPYPYFSTYRQTAQQFCIIMFFLLTWGIFYVEIGAPVSFQGELLSMSVLVIAAYLIGWIWLKLTTLPALIGMLLTGILFRNLGWVTMTDEYRKLNQDLRKVALVIILTRAGLGLDANVLKKHYAAVLQLGLLPWIVECIAIGVTTHYLLHLPWIWGFLLGSMIASVSPAVVVPCLFRLRDVGYGVSKGIPTLVLAATAIDDSISVAIFAIILNAMFSTGSTTYNIIKAPLSIIAGIVLGSLWGTLASVVPEKGDTYVVPLRFLFLLLGGLFSLFISGYIEWSGAGPLAIVSSGFVAAFYWEKQGWPINKHPVSNIFRILWIFFEPILFAFTGAQITISELDPQLMQMGAICLVSCLVLRVIATFLVSFGCGLNNKEKLFIGLTWMAKATVQAALGPAALYLVNNGGSAGGSVREEKQHAEALLAVSVLSVVISAPLGAVLIAITGPRLLNKEQSPDKKLEENITAIDAINNSTHL
ncbi:sodium/hydrogen exchanger 9B2-like isoform X1 [Ostrinia furnacalis]|uniref:sodium/hydrogen exchanger 9B2-like isoform X1 n=1 Tax=Ostrinia furnacalis TaxID=93504 RepID=UPI00103CA0A7|nr:sodium/hydrogen exchanger 9B2-like isoform X1 [Ostrinia furnacalis]XP_028167639.1 sodium/hydrogen exchanger 9B2-like isoform X1 [Ostrinia furnacalis]XP_028167640.1 sodium/hydrogen exchanger 9B2-like isoform X1 [Ostrinia furnacalis]XP_028167641.1 sodium/hydrogen exchanger 9B2-like isoform X1 [Ostrinia furnacalis]